MIRVVLTGGPSGGKTTIATSLKNEFGSRAAVVPEAASMLFAGGFPRREPPELRRFQQRAIYFLQRELENLIAAERTQAQVMLCDRGSLDGLAYWPLGPEDFFRDIPTRLEDEIRRYHWVLHLDTAAQADYDTTNQLRTEPYPVALQINERIRRAWESHPHHLVIPSRVHFVQKIELTVHVIERILQGATVPEIQEHIRTATLGA